MKIIKIEPYENGAHANQTSSSKLPVPDGWAAIPDDMEIPASFPFVDIEASDGVVTSMTEREIPAPTPKTPSEMREEAYNTEKLIEWSGESLTVTEAATKWLYYAAEDNAKAADIMALIVAAKTDIRHRYPDEEVNQ